jgi:3-dehydroquinate synthase
MLRELNVVLNKMNINLMRKINESYDLIFGNNMFEFIGEDLKEMKLGSKYAIITDSNVIDLYAYNLEVELKSQGIKCDIFCFKAGEKSKNLATCEQIIEEMSAMKYGRDSVIIALGGGVVGDISGFIAAIFNRGVPFIQIPTTILAQADSSIGGKTGVDTEHGKNLVGAFKQPCRVYLDVSTLKTLPEREVRNGLAETIKHGVIQDSEFFYYLHDNMQKLLEKNTSSLLYVARNNCTIKGKIVEQDPHEKGLRKILNYGHTVGHAVEKISNYCLSHGESIALGMMAAGRIAVKLGYFKETCLESQEELLVKAGLPIRIPEEISDEAIIEATSRDKKAKEGKVNYCLPLEIGKMHHFNYAYVTFVENKIVKATLKETR